ncbi:ribonuclease III [Phycisphaera mikurensis]|uniref:Ribonuclease 3 n=1 Tax=Phycisphaera mikurensis (strain NBRC 102666 / KCTC 22515 / FYK2301M01) TaxID=1142394 RepID=I0IGT8_PHYMF|nr:ribonuclease III [Phycisphaera mikurensis]MBB6440733.1 ribonuclease-3 [Phycisphaera mikurensis]BAM04476.1 ribonuclease III [Phycisphaera mikurensis NBRC 102666]
MSESAPRPAASDADRIERAQAALGHRFADAGLLAEALRHASAAGPGRPSNERLEFLGDAVIELCVCEALFERFPDRPEGELSVMKSAVVSRVACAAAADRLGLVALLQLGPGMRARARLADTLGGNAFEAVVAALHLDAGLPTARAFVLDHLGDALEEAATSTHQRNFKSALQDFAQAHLGGRALYEPLGSSGPGHRPVFRVAAVVAGRRFGEASASTKKGAEQAAAEAALHAMRAEPGDLPPLARAQLDALLG